MFQASYFLLSVGVLLQVLIVVNAELITPSIWPQPVEFQTSTGLTNVGLFEYTSKNGAVNTLEQAYKRYNAMIFQHNTESSDTTPVEVIVDDNSEAYPQLDTDESYSLTIPSPENSGEPIKIEAKTVYGALYGLESLSQLVMYDYDKQRYIISATPIRISDSPRYKHRGMLLDTARHFQPIPFIQRVVDSLSYSKYNVLHWHVVDTQSFPFESKTYPKLWKGAYTKPERYSQADIKDLVEYGRLRGVKVMIEFDMPGHASSWCKGYPEVCPSETCTEPLDPSSNATFPLIRSLLGECNGANDGNTEALFPYQFIHLGGDEVDYKCWENDAEIQQWEKEQGFSGSEDTYKYFVEQTASIAREQNRLPVQWVEVFEHFGSTLSKDIVIHVWKEKTTLDEVLSAGYKALLSNQDDWYLDHETTSWQTMYKNEPTAGLSKSSDPSLILGGESCMWAENIDPSDLFNTVWPRAAAVGEVLWSPKIDDSVDMDKVENRLQTFRCLLTQRGISAAPVNNHRTRMAPPNPGSCYYQR